MLGEDLEKWEKCEFADFILSIRGKKEIIFFINGKAVKIEYGQLLLENEKLNEEEKCELVDFIMKTSKNKMLICLNDRIIRIDLIKLKDTINKDN